MKSVLWISRHEMTQPQRADLERVMGGSVCLLPWRDTVRDVAELAPVLQTADAVAAVLPPELLSHLLDGWVYTAIPAWRTPKNYPAAYLCLTIPIYLISLLAGKLLHAAVAACTKSGKRGEIRFSRQIP